MADTEVTVTPFTLVTVEELVDALGLPQQFIGDLTPTLVSAIQRATIRVENILRTTFKPLSFKETFFLGRDALSLDGFYRLRLSAGLLRAASPLAVANGYEWQGTYRATPSADLIPNLDKGVIFLPTSYRENYITVDYSSGFHADDEGADVPDEIKQAIITLAPRFMMSVSSVNAEQQGNKSTEADPKMAEANAADLLQRYSRRIGATVEPMATVKTVYVPPVV